MSSLRLLRLLHCCDICVFFHRFSIMCVLRHSQYIYDCVHYFIYDVLSLDLIHFFLLHLFFLKAIKINCTWYEKKASRRLVIKIDNFLPLTFFKASHWNGSVRKPQPKRNCFFVPKLKGYNSADQSPKCKGLDYHEDPTLHKKEDEHLPANTGDTEKPVIRPNRPLNYHCRNATGGFKVLGW